MKPLSWHEVVCCAIEVPCYVMIGLAVVWAVALACDL
jgi:hypothetical protein